MLLLLLFQYDYASRDTLLRLLLPLTFVAFILRRLLSGV